MKRKNTSLALSCFSIIVLMLALAQPASAQTTERVWDNGTVWSITYVETKPNMFNSYVKNLSQVWRAFLEEQKRQGQVISYRMLNVQNPRDGEPNLMLLTEFKNMEVFDTTADEFDEMSKKVMGSLKNLQSDNIEREKMRTIRSTVLTREIYFKNGQNGVEFYRGWKPLLRSGCDRARSAVSRSGILPRCWPQQKTKTANSIFAAKDCSGAESSSYRANRCPPPP